MPPDRLSERRRSFRFLLLYALAWAGSTIAYVPFLTLLLPLRLAEMRGQQGLELLAYFTFAGAAMASVSNILFGWLSDWTHDRRHWIAAGLVLNVLSLIAFNQVGTPRAMLALLLFWQFSLNMMLAPLAALAGDYVPDRQKGVLGGLIAFAPAAGSASSVVITIPGFADADGRILIVAGMVVAALLPLLLFGETPSGRATPAPIPALVAPRARWWPRRRDGVARMWFARFAVQIAEAMLFAFLLFYFRDIDPQFKDSDVARLYGFVTAGAVPIAIAAGRWSDRRGRPILPLTVCAGIAAASLLAMAAAHGEPIALAAYVAFGLATAVFLSLHTGQTLRVLRNPARRGRDLGLFNLTNTIPSLIMPWLTLSIVPDAGYGALFAVLALLAGCAALSLASIGIPGPARTASE